ncbi:MAG: glycosyltransferase family 4 protein, partial [Thaumarchaeota archaeon]|nr:glycosyltransferase family 4 protein [Nitrososphaerota archaeon]
SLAMKNVKGKKILSLQGNYSKQILFLHGNTAGIISKKLEKSALEWADVITVPSKQMYEEYLKNGYNVSYVPNGIDISSFPKDEDRRYKKQLIFAGRLSKEKGILDLLKFVEIASKDIDIIIIGSGPEESKVREVAELFSNLHFLGYQSKRNTIKLIRGSDMMIQPSIMEGGTSSSLLESMACKTSIIATSVDGNKETIVHMSTAYVVSANNPIEINNAVNYLFDNPEKQKIIINNAYDLVYNYDWEHIGQKYLDIYNGI